MRISKTQKGITLVALIITIIILLILAVVAIRSITGDGILLKAREAADATARGQAQEELDLAISNLRMEEVIRKNMSQEEKAQWLKSELQKQDGNATVNINGEGFTGMYKEYNFTITEDYKVIIGDYAQNDNNQSSGNEEISEEEKWDKSATSEDAFIWLSDDPNSPDYGVVIGYTEKAINYTILRYPTRCTKISFKYYEDRYTEIGSYGTSRSYTYNIQKVEIPKTVTHIDTTAFGSLYADLSFRSLTSIYIPQSVETMGWVFSERCASLETIYCEAYEKPEGWISDWNDGCTAEVIWGAEQVSLSGAEWNEYTVAEDAFIWKSDDQNSPDYGVIIGYTSNLQNYALLKYPSRCTQIKFEYNDERYRNSGISHSDTSRSFTQNALKIIVPGTVKSLDLHYSGNDFYVFRGVEEIELQEGIRNIESSAFVGLWGLNKINIPNTVISIGDYAFENRTNIRSIVIPENVTNIGARAFGNWQANQTINCRAASKPEGWDDNWAGSNPLCTINWGYTGE